MEKQWKKIAEGKYSFLIDNREAGSMEMLLNTNERKAVLLIDGTEYLVKQTGFWKTTIEIENAAGQLIAKAYYEKWYANSWVLEYKNCRYKIVIRNNPLAEWAILLNDELLLAYGLYTENGKLSLRITGSTQNDHLFDFLLWYLFVPIATENMGDHFVFTMLLQSQ